MFMQIAVSPDKTHQEDFLRAAVLSHCTKETWSRFAGMKFQPLQPEPISPYNYMSKSTFNPPRRDRFPPDICLQKPIDSHWFKNVYKMMKFYKSFVFFSQIHIMPRKNTIEVTTIYWNLLLWNVFHPA